MKIPEDPAILLSYINTLLRDKYQSLDALCGDMELDKDKIKERLSAIAYEYKPERNQFV